MLLLHRNVDGVDVLAGITAALSVGSTNPDVVALEARKAAERREPPALADAPARTPGWWSWRSIAARACLLMNGRCPRWTSTTCCWAGKARDPSAQVTEQAATAAIEQGCRMLRLPTIRDRFEEIAAAAEREQLTYLGFLSELVIAECDDRDRRRAERRIRDAGFPRPKRLEEFSFDANPAINSAVIGQLASCAWVKAGTIVFDR